MWQIFSDMIYSQILQLPVTWSWNLSCALTHLLPLNMECAPCLDPEFDTAHHYDYALLCNYTHNICTLHMLSWPRLRSDSVQNMNLYTHSVRHTTHIKIFWSAESSQTCVTWPPWGGRKGMSSNKPTIAPSPIRALVIFKKLPSFENKPQISKLQPNLTSSCGTLKARLLSLITFAMHVV